MGTNLRQKQTAALNRMLNFNVPLADSEGGVVNPSEWSDHVSRTCLPRAASTVLLPLPPKPISSQALKPKSIHRNTYTNSGSC